MVNYECEKCGKTFTQKSNFETHMNRKIQCTEQLSVDGNNICKICNKAFQSRSGLYYHSKNELCEPHVTIVDKQQNIENNTNVENMNVEGDVKVVKFGEENLSYISDDTFKKIIGRGFKSLEEFMNHVHFNKDHPENHNIYVASMKDGHVVTFDGKKWNVGIADQVLDDIIQQKSDILEDKYDEIVDKLSPMESKKFNNFINRKDDARVNLKLKRELRVQLYNNRHFAKDARKLLEEKEKIIKQKIENGEKDKVFDQENEIKKALDSLKDKNLSDLDPEKAKFILNVLNSV
jgi:hypothetical protein